MVQSFREIPRSNKKERIVDIHNNLDEIQGHYMLMEVGNQSQKGNYNMNLFIEHP